MNDLTPAEAEALKVAAEMIDAGIPVFAAAPNPDKPGEYFLPKQWEKTVPSHVWLEKWRPGWALGAVGGHVADFLDFDPRNGGAESRKELEIQGQLPRSFGTQATPSGGTHEVISLTGERKGVVMPGVDLQSGAAEPLHGSHGRGFIFIAPTVRPSKAPETLGQLRAYEWVTPPDFGYLAEFGPGTDDTVEGIVARVHARRAEKPRESAPGAAPGTSSLFSNGGRDAEERAFTRAEAEAFCTPHLAALEAARIGEIEEHANRAAATLSHFVPALWDADFAYAVLLAALDKTAYDPSHPASGWTAGKFRPVLDGRRPPLDNWKAVERVQPDATDVQPAPEDAVEAMLSRMLSAEQMAGKQPPEPLVWGLLDRDTIAALVGMPGSFKSFVALDLAGHVGRGEPWHGMRVEQGEVVYIAAEGERGMTLRVRAWEKVHGPMRGVRFLPEPVQTRDAGAWKVLVEACRRIGPALVIIDTQSMVTIGANENDNGEMNEAIFAFRAIKKATGACVAPVHHTTKTGETTRGAGAQDGAHDTRLKLERVQPRSSMVVRVKDEKQKDMAETGGGFLLMLESVDLGVDPRTGKALSSLVVADDNAFKMAAGQEEPEQWVASSLSVADMVVRALTDHGMDRGITKPEAYAIVLERFYGGVKTRLHKSTWHTAWNRALKHDGVINTGGQRFTFDPLEGSE